MKKSLVAVLVVILAGAAGLAAFWPQVRLWQVKQALDHLLIPAIKAQYQATYGQEPVIAYQGPKADGSAFVLEDFSLAMTGQLEIKSLVKTLRIDNVDLSLLGDLKSCDMAITQGKIGIKGMVVNGQAMDVEGTMESVAVTGLAVRDGGKHIRVASQTIKNFVTTNTLVPFPITIQEAEAKNYEVTFGPQYKSFQASMGAFNIKMDQGIAARTEAFSLGADNLAWKDGAGYFDQAKLQVKGLAVSLPLLPGPEPFLNIANLDMNMSRKPQRAADRVEMKGLTWKNKGDDKALAALKELGYADPRVNITYDYIYDQAAQTFDCPEITVAMEKAGSLSLGFALKDVQVDLTGGNPVQMVEKLKDAKPIKLSLRYDDASLFDKLLTLGAKKQGMTVEQLRAKLLQELPPLPGAVAPEPALLHFISHPGSLCLLITPRQELTMEQYGKMGPALAAVLEMKLDNCAK